MRDARVMDTQSDLAGHDRRRAPRSGGTPGRRALFSVFRWLGDHVRGFYAAVGVFLIIAIAIIAICGLIFVELAGEVMEGETQAFDNAVLLWMHGHATPKLTGMALDVTALGSGTVMWFVVLVASVFLWGSRHRWSVGLLWVSLIGSGLINTTLKEFFSRPRPDLFPWRAPYAGEASFPSGHSMTAMVAYSTLAYLIARLEPNRALRRFTYVVCAITIVLIGISRMYLGVHYPSDVLAGFLMGLAWASFCALGVEALRYFRRRKPDIITEEHDLNGPAEAPAKA